jgi:hypothetical protein
MGSRARAHIASRARELATGYAERKMMAEEHKVLVYKSRAERRAENKALLAERDARDAEIRATLTKEEKKALRRARKGGLA